MAKKVKLEQLSVTDKQREMLRGLASSRKSEAREVTRAKILLAYSDGDSISKIGRDIGVSRPTIYKCLSKAFAAGVAVALKDTYHRPHAPEILDDAKAWVISLACTKPTDHGLAAELWSNALLAKFVSEHADAAGFPRLKKAAKATIWRILNENEIKPHKIEYYLEKRDPEFDSKMHEVLCVYRDVSLYQAHAIHDRRPYPIYTVSIDEKPGVQAIGLTAPDLPPIPGKKAAFARDHEYVRHGTVSIIAGIDLHTGHIFCNVEDRHRSIEFISLLKRMDDHYPQGAIIRLILDNHSTHISKETRDYLATRPGRFEYIHTPKHGSWLNIIECVFSKMARTFLRHIRVESIAELKMRILKGIDEFNASPVIFRWKKFNFDLV